MDIPNLVEDIARFRAKFPWDGEFYQGKPRLLPEDQMQFWMNFIDEERREWITHSEDAAITEDPGKIAYHLGEMLDAGVDVIYVVLGVLQRQGMLPMFYEAWRRVHEANMAKVCANGDASLSARGNAWDVIKPAGWVAPVHTDLVQDHAHYPQGPSPNSPLEQFIADVCSPDDSETKY